MIAESLYSKLKKLKVSVQVVDDRLDLKAPKNVLNAALLNEIKEHKEALKALLVSYKKRNRKYTAISPLPLQEDYPVSSGQKRLWILQQFEGSGAAYNMPGVYLFKGDLNLNALQSAFNALIERHEILRTVFSQNKEGEVRQYILASDTTGFHITYKDLDKEPEPLGSLLENICSAPFDLARGPLLRAGVYRQSAREFVFAYCMHHIISDGLSMDILISELLQFYNLYTGAIKETALNPLRIQYKDYSSWQQEQLSGASLQAQREYWLKQFEGDLPVLELVPGGIRPSMKTYQGKVVYKQIDAHTSTGLKRIIQEQGATLFMGLLSVVNTVLYRYSSQDDIIIGSPITGRDHPDLEQQIGFYVNMLALRTRFSGSDHFITLLNKVKQLTLDAYEHQVYPFDELVDALDLQRDMSRNPLFDVMLIVQHMDQSQEVLQGMGNLDISVYPSGNTVLSKFDFTFNFEDYGSNLSLGLEYNSDIYPSNFVEGLATHVLGLMAAIVANPEKELHQLNFLDGEEEEQLLRTFNNTRADYPATKTIVDLFEAQVSQTPSAIALMHGEKQLTYEELNGLANQFAHYLRNNYSIQQESLVGIKLERDEWMLITLLGTLKSGGAYVPIDVDYPRERIDYMLSDSRCEVLIDGEELGKFKNQLSQLSSSNLQSVNKPDHLAYVIYTSGSTGNPKGVMIEHGNAVAFISWCMGEFAQSDFDVVFAVTSICFDLSVFELFYPLCVGKKIRLLTNALEAPVYLSASENILLNMVPSAVGALLHEGADFTNVKVLNMAGEPIPEKYIAALDVSHIEIRNLYGPSEDTTYSSVYRIKDQSGPILIGHPISNTAFYILNSGLQLQAPGVMGEIYISGKGLSRGYLNRGELTAEKFIPNPFVPGERMYRTGDLGRWTFEGEMEFLGRIDHQVKIRGYRIELGEIENTLERHPFIASAAVIARAGFSGEKEIVAYFVCKQEVMAAELRSFLGITLPSYMIPAHWVKLEEMPLTPNGKIDRKKLSALDTSGISSEIEYIAPRNETEEKLLTVWKEVLNKTKISIRDNFFELGGNSLKVLKMIAAINKELSLKLKIQDIYQHPTIETLAGKRMEFKVMIKLQDAKVKDGKNIYFVPPVTGNSILFKPLAQMLGKNFNSFGFQYPGLENEAPLFGSIEQAAAVFSKQIVENENSEHVILVGYSMGGNMAFEMAKILEVKKFNISLVLIDSVAKTDIFVDPDATNAERETEWLIKQYKTIIGEAEIREEQFLKLFLNNNFKLFNKYKQTGTIKSNLYLFEAEENRPATDMKKWNGFTKGEILHSYIQGGHWDAMNEVNLPVYKKAIIEQAVDITHVLESE